MSGSPTPLARAEDVAAYLGVSKLYVYELCRLGRIPAIRVGRLLRFDMDEVKAALVK